MLDQARVFEELEKAGVRFFAGVPDSYLNGFCNHALAHFSERTVIAANEGNAVGIAAGHWLATGELPLVFMQNSGIGNAVNPLASLADVRVYAVPLLLLIGWRGQPGMGDWPQHELQGAITAPLMDVLEIPHAVLQDDDSTFASTVQKAVVWCKAERKPFALIAPKGVMAGEKANNRDATYPMSREEAIETILDHMPAETVYCATTGRATRELFFLRERRGEGKERDFLNVGAMGHASSVALGIALAKPERPVVVLDGDCAAIMHMGALTMASKVRAPNLLHAVLNNGAHESVGGQPSAGHLVNFTTIAEGCGYRTVGRAVTSKEELVAALVELRSGAEVEGETRPAFVDVRIHRGLSGKLPPLDFSHRGAVDALAEELRR